MRHFMINIKTGEMLTLDDSYEAEKKVYLKLYLSQEYMEYFNMTGAL